MVGRAGGTHIGHLFRVFLQLLAVGIVQDHAHLRHCGPGGLGDLGHHHGVGVGDLLLGRVGRIRRQSKLYVGGRRCRGLPGGILVVVGLSVAGAGRLDTVVDDLRFFKAGEESIGGLLDRGGAFQNREGTRIGLGKLLPQVVHLHFQVANRCVAGLGKLQQSSLPAVIGPLSQTVACSIRNEILIRAIVHRIGVSSVCVAKFLFIAVLEVDGFQGTFGLQVSHQTGHTILVADLSIKIVPDLLRLHRGGLGGRDGGLGRGRHQGKHHSNRQKNGNDTLFHEDPSFQEIFPQNFPNYTTPHHRAQHMTRHHPQKQKPGTAVSVQRL